MGSFLDDVVMDVGYGRVAVEWDVRVLQPYDTVWLQHRFVWLDSYQIRLLCLDVRVLLPYDYGVSGSISTRLAVDAMLEGWVA